MTERTWRDYDTHLMQQGTARNDYFHATTRCPRINDPELTVDRPESYVAYHEPDPCATCHPGVAAPDHDEQLVIVPGDRFDAHYHRDEHCVAVEQMTDPQRMPPESTDAEPCSTCVGPDGEMATVLACPECDSPAVRRLVKSDGWTCRAKGCGATFDEPVERGNRGGNDGPATGLARELLEADPEDVSAEHAGGGSA
ncbi:eL43 family ribosomal protein [Haloarcula sediminis]|uniref:hypothetical protein n=1 Tax=Haloarcula sediminis TaxID=3111777 RepID=UPI002D77B1BD|nr:hypothetical protein [Haloarcula sp. CK38]